MRRIAIVSSVLFVLAHVVATAQNPRTPASAVHSEIARVRSQMQASGADDQRASMLQRLDRADSALKAQHAYLALYLLEAAYEAAGASAFARSADVRSPADFVRKWTALGAPKPHRQAARPVPATVDALAEAAEDRGRATYQASRPYAEDSGTDAGLYYLGESHASMNYSEWVRSATWPDVGRRPRFRRIDSEIAAFDREITTTYEKMARADHPTYIRASAALKQARSLDDHNAREGALFQYLLSRYLFAPLRGPAAADATQERITAARATLPAGEDHSIAELFLDLADEGASSTNADLRRGAATVIEDLIPAYRAAIAPAASTTTTAAHANAAVTITLVRWPFT